MNWRSHLQRSSALVATGLLAAAFSGEAAHAQGASVEELRQTIQQQQQQLQQQQLLLQQMQQQLDQVSAQAAQAAAGVEEVREVKHSASPDFSDPEGNFTFGFRGRLQGDFVYFNDEGDGDDPGDYDFDSGTGFRRARMGLEGTMYQDWKWRIEADFAEGDGVSLEDAYIQYKGIEGLTFTALQHKYPFSIENLTSSRFITFMERPLIVNAFGGDTRRIGLSAKHGSEFWTLAAGIFGDNAEVGRGDDDDPDEGWLAAARLTVAPVNRDEQVVHLGMNAVWQIDTQGEEVRFRDRPELRVDGTRLVDTGTLGGFGDDTQGIEDYYLFGPELAAVFGPFHVQGEYHWVKVNGDDLILDDAGTPTGGDPTFTGWYVEAGYFLTGESRPYDEGSFDRVKPKRNFSLQDGGPGAWQIAARYSTIDLDDEGIEGGEEDNITVGLNWHFNPYMRWQLNWVRFDVEQSPAVGGEDLKSWGLGTRLQVDW